jgi:hypothetical protein
LLAYAVTRAFRVVRLPLDKLGRAGSKVLNLFGVWFLALCAKTKNQKS